MSQPLPTPDPGAAPELRSRPRGRVLRRVLAALLILLAVLALAAVAGGLWLRGRIQASLPRLDGEMALAGLSAPVEIERDELGVPSIRGANRLDVVRALVDTAACWPAT